MPASPAVQSATSRRVERPTWLPQEEWPFALRSLDLNGRPIHYVDEGHGPVLLFVHAGMWSFVWRDAIVRLRGRFRCVTLDFPSHGLTDAIPDSPVSLRAHAETLNRFCDALGLDDVTFVLHDLGGWSASRPPWITRSAREPSWPSTPSPGRPTGPGCG